MLNGKGTLYSFQPTYNWLVCATYWEAAGGIGAHDLLAILETEGSARRDGNFPCSSAGACGGMQFMLRTWQNRKPFADADINSQCDAMGGASNLVHANQAWAMSLSEPEYEAHFRGWWKQGTTWNNHHEQSVATYRLARLIYAARLEFWKKYASVQ